jgi:hypothetical protein
MACPRILQGGADLRQGEIINKIINRMMTTRSQGKRSSRKRQILQDLTLAWGFYLPLLCWQTETP